MPEMMLHLLALASRASLDFCNWTCFYCHFNYISGQNFKVTDKRDYKDGDLQQFENMRLYGGGTTHLTMSWLPVSTSSLPTSALMWQYCLSDDTYHSGELACSNEYLHLNGEHKEK